MNEQDTRLIYRGELEQKLSKSTYNLASGGPQFVTECESKMNILSVEIYSLLQLEDLIIG